MYLQKFNLNFSILKISAVFTPRKCHGYTSYVSWLRLVNAMVTPRKWHAYNLQMTVFGLSTMLCKGCKNVKTGAFLPRFCINIQNDRKIANEAFFFHNA